MNFPVLSVITFTPIVAALIILLIPAHRKNEARVVALAAASFALILSSWVYLQYSTRHLTGYQFIEKYDWLPLLGISLLSGRGLTSVRGTLAGHQTWPGVYRAWVAQSRVGIRVSFPSRKMKHFGR